MFFISATSLVGVERVNSVLKSFSFTVLFLLLVRMENNNVLPIKLIVMFKNILRLHEAGIRKRFKNIQPQLKNEAFL